MIDGKTKMSDEELENVVGGNTNYFPNNSLLKSLGLFDCVETYTSVRDQYYKTWQGDDWRVVRS